MTSCSNENLHNCKISFKHSKTAKDYFFYSSGWISPNRVTLACSQTSNNTRYFSPTFWLWYHVLHSLINVEIGRSTYVYLSVAVGIHNLKTNVQASLSLFISVLSNFFVEKKMIKRMNQIKNLVTEIFWKVEEVVFRGRRIAQLLFEKNLNAKMPNAKTYCRCYCY